MSWAFIYEVGGGVASELLECFPLGLGDKEENEEDREEGDEGEEGEGAEGGDGVGDGEEREGHGAAHDTVHKHGEAEGLGPMSRGEDLGGEDVRDGAPAHGEEGDVATYGQDDD